MALHKATEFLAAADACLRLGYPNASASRSYYAMFHGALHALQVQGITGETWSHESLHATFSRELMHRRKIYSRTLARLLPDTMAMRIQADYRGNDVSMRAASLLVKQAREFLERIKEANPS